MRQKRNYMILTFHTTTEAMAMDKQCSMHQIPGRLIPVPREITAGCGLAWRMKTEEYAVHENRIQELNIRFQQITELCL